jgi:protein TonB
MRWSMLPVSVAIHAAALVVFLIVPLAADIDLPTPWPAGSRNYVVASAATAPLPVQSSRVVSPVPHAAPTRAPDHIEAEVEDAGSATVADGGLPSIAATSTGVPDGLNIGAVAPPPPPPPPVAEHPQLLRVGGSIREPRKVVDAPVAYPEIARQARVEGLVILEATIDERGLVTDARVLRSEPLLDGAALAAVRQWRYTPTLLNGVPVRVLMTITFNFKLSDRVP